MDNCGCPHLKVSSKKENPGDQHRTDLETRRERNAAKSIQFGAVIGLTVSPKKRWGKLKLSLSTKKVSLYAGLFIRHTISLGWPLAAAIRMHNAKGKAA